MSFPDSAELPLRPTGLSRRQLLTRMVAGPSLLGAAALLNACGASGTPGASVPAATAAPTAKPIGVVTPAAASKPSPQAATASPVAAASPVVGASPAAAQGGSSAAFDQLLAAAKREGQVNLWSNVPSAATLPRIQQAFDQKFGGGIRIEQTPLSAGEAASRLIAEAQANRFAGDMAQPSPDIASNLLRANLAEKRDWESVFGSRLPGIKNAVESVAIPELQGVALSYWDVVYVLLYNTNLVTEDQLPKNWDDLTAASMNGKLAVDVRGYPFNFLALHPDWGRERTERLVRSINGLSPMKQPGAPPVADAVARGDIPMGLGSVADVAVQQRNGRPVKARVFEYVPLNNLMAFVPKQPAHPNAAQLFAAWMTTEGIDIVEAQDSNGRVTKTGSPTNQAVYSQQPNAKLCQARSLTDMQTAADFLKRAGNIFTGAA